LPRLTLLFLYLFKDFTTFYIHTNEFRLLLLKKSNFLTAC